MDKLDNDIISIIKKYLKCRTFLCKYDGKELLYPQNKDKIGYYCSDCYKAAVFDYFDYLIKIDKRINGIING